MFERLLPVYVFRDGTKLSTNQSIDGYDDQIANGEDHS
jgi:hypothetical protein